jgi:hypothetical protein
MFWVSLGAAAGYYAARRGQVVVDEARERGLVGNLTWAASTASKATAAAAVASVSVGEALGTRSRRFTHQHEPSADPLSGAQPGATSTDPSTREARP